MTEIFKCGKWIIPSINKWSEFSLDLKCGCLKLFNHSDDTSKLAVTVITRDMNVRAVCRLIMYALPTETNKCGRALLDIRHSLPTFPSYI